MDTQHDAPDHEHGDHEHGDHEHGDHEHGEHAEVPETGDPSIDAVLTQLAAVTNRPLEEHIAAGEHAHRVLQGRLSDLGGE